MNKKELVESIADAANIDKTAAEKALNGIMMAITDALKKSNTVTLVGFGTFSVSKREARQGTTPQNGDTIKYRQRMLPGLKQAANWLKRSMRA